MDTITLWDAIIRQLPKLRAAASYTMHKRMGVGRLGSVYEPEDLLQESILKIMRNKDQVKELGVNDRGLIALFYTTMHHVFLDWAYKPDMRNSVPNDVYSTEPTIGEAPAIVGVLDRESDRQQVDGFITQLGVKSPVTALAVLYSLDVRTGESYTDMANTLGVSENAFKQRRFDGIRTMRSFIPKKS